MAKFRILSIDGGGIRGVIAAEFLKSIALRMRNKDSSTQLSDCFDLIVGTSTGAIIAASVALEKDLDESSKLFDEFGPRIFPIKLLERKYRWNPFTWFEPEYEESNLGDALKNLFSQGTRLDERKKELIITSYNVFTRDLFIMRSFDPNTGDIKVWEACKASCSAPTYFPAHILEHSGAGKPLIDGGIFANNPSLLALAEAVKLLNKHSIKELHQDTDIILVSLGTGSLQRPIQVSDAKTWGPAQWVRPLIDVMFDGTSELSHYCAESILTAENYVRLQVDLKGVNDDLDDASSKNINNLRLIAQAFISSTEGMAALDRIEIMLS